MRTIRQITFFTFGFIFILSSCSQSSAMKRFTHLKRFVKPGMVARQFCLHCPIVEGDERGVRRDLLRGANANAMWGSMSAVALAIKHNEPYVASILIKEGNADPNLGNTRTGKTPLHLAAEKNGTQLCEDLIEHGADVNARDKNGRTPLHDAVEQNAKEVSNLLLLHGADPEARDNQGRLPAAKKGLFEKVKIFIGASDQEELAREHKQIKGSCKDKD